MVQIIAYFEQMQIVRKLKPTKSFAQEYKFTRLFLARQLLVYYGAGDVPCKHGSPPRIITLMVKEACTMSRTVKNSPTCVPGACWKDLENLKIATKFYSKGKLKIIRKMHQQKFPSIH